MECRLADDYYIKSRKYATIYSWTVASLRLYFCAGLHHLPGSNTQNDRSLWMVKRKSDIILLHFSPQSGAVHPENSGSFCFISFALAENAKYFVKFDIIWSIFQNRVCGSMI